MPTKQLWFSATSVLLFLTGCARIGASTEVKADGSFVRTVVYRGSAPSTEGFTMGPSLDELIAPPRTPGWKVTREKDPKSESDLIVTATRAFASGETLSNDLALKSPPPKDAPQGTLSTLILGNTLSVRTLPDGTMEYREVIRWRGTKPSELTTPEPELLALLATTVPSLDKVALATVTTHLQQSLWRALFGPDEPVLGLLITHPELGEFRLKKRLAATVDAELKTALGEKLTDTERRTATQKVIITLTQRVRDTAKKQVNTGPGGDNKGDALVAILLKAKLPGKLIKTNGEEDPATGEVVWGLFSPAPAAGDVVLTAICDPKN